MASIRSIGASCASAAAGIIAAHSVISAPQPWRRTADLSAILPCSPLKDETREEKPYQIDAAVSLHRFRIAQVINDCCRGATDLNGEPEVNHLRGIR